MRRALQLTFFGIFLVSALVGVLIGYLSVDWVTRDLIERELDIAHAAIKDKFSTFDILLGREEVRMEKQMEKALPVVVRELLGHPPAFPDKTDDELAALSQRLGVDNVYVIDKNTVIVATDFAPDKGFELGTISDGFRSFMTGLVGTGEFVTDRINLSSKTGILTKYGYLSPAGSEYIAEVSIDVRKYLTRERSPEFVGFLFNSFFRDLIGTQEFLTGIDIHMVNPVGQFSLFDQNTNLPRTIVDQLRTDERITAKSGNQWTVYSKISPVDSRLSTADFLAITTMHDFSDLAGHVQRVVALIVAMMVVASGIAYLFAERLASYRVIARIENIRHGVSIIADGDYGHDLAVEGRDEITDIVDDINQMRARIEEDIRRREADAERLAGAIIEAETARENAEAASRAKSEFLSVVSHELRTPLTSIQGSIGLIRSGASSELPGGTEPLAEIAYNNCERLSALIDDILDMEKIESGKMEFRMDRLEVVSLIREAIEANKGYGNTYRVTFVSDDMPDEVHVTGDKDRLMQVLSNLMSNAAKFSPPGEQVMLSLAREDGTVRVSISDKGPGIPASFRDKIFDKFTQSDSTDTREVGGTGLRLSISKAIVEHHGGEIDYESKVGSGSTFYFTLPA